MAKYGVNQEECQDIMGLKKSIVFSNQYGVRLRFVIKILTELFFFNFFNKQIVWYVRLVIGDIIRVCVAISFNFFFCYLIILNLLQKTLGVIVTS